MFNLIIVLLISAQAVLFAEITFQTPIPQVVSQQDEAGTITGLAAVQGHWREAVTNKENFCDIPSNKELQKIQATTNGRVNFMSISRSEVIYKSWPHTDCQGEVLNGKNRNRFHEDICAPPNEMTAVITLQGEGDEELVFRIITNSESVSSPVSGPAKFELRNGVLIETFNNAKCAKENKKGHFYYLPVHLN